MAKDIMKWFRFYYEVAEDPKVQTLPARLFKLWVNVLCLAAKNKGVVPPMPQIAYALRMGRARVDLDMAALERVGLFDETSTGLTPHNWNGRQFESDSRETEGRRKHDEGRRKHGARWESAPRDDGAPAAAEYREQTTEAESDA